ncbi:hypothetical protein BDV29DRAFT_176739, partial [Aspergillus leporis]
MEERLKNWESAMFANGIETPQNLLCLCKHVHALWNKARSILRPIATCPICLEIEFYWLPAGN